MKINTKHLNLYIIFDFIKIKRVSKKVSKQASKGPHWGFPLSASLLRNMENLWSERLCNLWALVVKYRTFENEQWRMSIFLICSNQFEPSDQCGRWGRYQLWVATKHECSTMILLTKIFTPSNLWKVILSLVGSACEKKFHSIKKTFDLEGCLNFVLCLSSCIYK